MFFFSFFSSFLFSSVLAGTPVSDSKTTAFNTLLSLKPTIDLRLPEAKIQLVEIEKQNEAVFDKVLTASGKTAFYRQLPFLPGQVLLGLDKATYSRLRTLADSKGFIDLKSQKTAIPELDALNARFGAIKMQIEVEFPQMSCAELYFEPDVNPRMVAPLYKYVPGVAYAEENGMGLFRHQTDVRHLVFDAHPKLYVFLVGWGGCEAGCSETQRRYYEVDIKGVRRIAVVGDAFPAGSDMEKYFLDP